VVLPKIPTICQEKRLEYSIGDDEQVLWLLNCLAIKEEFLILLLCTIDASAADELSLYKFCFMRSQFA